MDILDFDSSYIFSGPPVYVNKQVSYTGHATTTYSIEQAVTIIDYIGQKSKSDFCLPFAVRLVENGEMISVAEDNGEFACGELLTTCLKKIEGFNVLVCVSRKVDNCYVSDRIQSQKHRAIKEAATKALDLLFASLTNATAVPTARSNYPVAPNSDTTLIFDTPPQQYQQHQQQQMEVPPQPPSLAPSISTENSERIKPGGKITVRGHR